VRREIPIALAIVASALTVAVLDGETGIRTWLETRRDLATAQKRVAELEGRVEAREGETAALRTDPLALERAIREDLRLARPGETIVRGLSGTPRPATR